jgi:glutamine amidotransferase
MCRLFGFRSAASERVHDALVLERNSLRRQSLEHPDGWGIASWQDGGLPRSRAAWARPTWIPSSSG